MHPGVDLVPVLVAAERKAGGEHGEQAIRADGLRRAVEQ
jgi:hypothetical protein